MKDLTLLIDGSNDRGSPGTAADRVQVLWDPAPLPSPPDAAAYIESRWSHYLAEAQRQGKTLFNSPITRLISAHRDSAGTVLLRLAPSDYKTFVVTRLRDRPWFEIHAPQAMALALGNSVLLSHGTQALLGIRSPNVSAYAARAHLIGGVLDVLDTPQYPASTAGLIAHLRTELHEEALITDADLHPPGSPNHLPRLLGLAHDDFLSQPEAIWQWETLTPLEPIAQRLAPAEHSASLLLTRGTMSDDLWSQMTPVARHAWQTWSH